MASMINETKLMFLVAAMKISQNGKHLQNKNHNCKAIIRPLKEEVLKLFSERSREERRTGPAENAVSFRPVRP